MTAHVAEISEVNDYVCRRRLEELCAALQSGKYATAIRMANEYDPMKARVLGQRDDVTFYCYCGKGELPARQKAFEAETARIMQARKDAEDPAACRNYQPKYGPKVSFYCRASEFNVNVQRYEEQQAKSRAEIFAASKTAARPHQVLPVNVIVNDRGNKWSYRITCEGVVAGGDCLEAAREAFDKAWLS